MKRYTMKRVNPNTADIFGIGIDGDEFPVKRCLSIPECKKFLAEHQEELTVYKIAEYSNRKDGKRHLIKTIYAKSEDEALEYFTWYDNHLTKVNGSKRRELLTGNWQLVVKNY